MKALAPNSNCGELCAVAAVARLSGVAVIGPVPWKPLAAVTAPVSAALCASRAAVSVRLPWMVWLPWNVLLAKNCA